MLTESISNNGEIGKLMDAVNLEEALNILRHSKENKRIIEGIENSSWENESDKLSALIASRYLNSISKGNNALELVKALEENIDRMDFCEYFKVPKYIKDAIEWLCR